MYFAKYLKTAGLSLALLTWLLTMAPALNAQSSTYTIVDALRTEEATMFDLGIVYLRQRLDRVVARYGQRNKAYINGFVDPDVKLGTIDLNVTVQTVGGLGEKSCETVRKYIVKKFLNLESGVGRAEAAGLIMGYAFLHRGVVTKAPSNVGVEMARRTTVTVSHSGKTCGGPLV